jgi:allophanate hydrolase subunit 2
VQTFVSADWTLNPKSDRTGHRPQLFFLPGRTEYLIHDAGADPSNIVIDPGAPVGTIQVPSGVEPIVMGVDSPRIGGYARIGAVISLEMSRVGQTRPGEVTRFVRVDQNEAPDGLREQEALLLDPGIISREVWV